MMKRYLILILLVTLALTSAVVVGCGQRQKHQDILDYLAKTNPLGAEFFEKIAAVMEAYPTSQDVMESLDVNRFLEVLANEKKTVSEALDTVNSAVSFLGNTPPPTEAETLHSLMIESFQTAKAGLLKLSYVSRIRYEYTYSMLNPSVPKKEFPPGVYEEMGQGLQLIEEAIRMWDEVGAEMDNLLQFIER